MFAIESLKICRFQTFWVGIFGRRTSLLFGYSSVQVGIPVQIFCQKISLNDLLMLTKRATSEESPTSGTPTFEKGKNRTGGVLNSPSNNKL